MKLFARFDTPDKRSLIWPDSCWLQSDRPVYIPDFAPAFVAIPALAAKVGRLGKHVGLKFAARYLSEWTSALVILPTGTLEDIKCGIAPAVEKYCYDNALTIGHWLPDSPAGSLTVRSRNIRNNPDSSASITEIPEIAQFNPKLSAAVADLSLYNTLKMGDVILIPLIRYAISLSENLEISITASVSPDKPLLTTRFK